VLKGGGKLKSSGVIGFSTEGNEERQLLTDKGPETTDNILMTIRFNIYPIFYNTIHVIAAIEQAAQNNSGASDLALLWAPVRHVQ